MRSLFNAAVNTWAETAGRRLESERLGPTGHRPWPMPQTPWVMAQTWQDLAFLHWPLHPSDLREMVPPGLSLDTFEGAAWLGITPFAVTGLRLRGLPAVPGLSSFQELNVRTYVTVDGKPGVFFFSLDANNVAAVELARRWYALPYFLAAGAMDRRGGPVHFTSRRRSGAARPAEFAAAYRAVGDPSPAVAGTLEWWLTERYCLYSVDQDGRLYRAEIHHPPWPLQRAEVEVDRNTMAVGLGARLDAQPALAHFARTLDVRVWSPEPITGVRRKLDRRRLAA
jgi:uncharacterized protein YqjF (DUF2071 family)